MPNDAGPYHAVVTGRDLYREHIRHIWHPVGGLADRCGRGGLGTWKELGATKLG